MSSSHKKNIYNFSTACSVELLTDTQDGGANEDMPQTEQITLPRFSKRNIQQPVAVKETTKPPSMPAIQVEKKSPEAEEWDVDVPVTEQTPMLIESDVRKSEKMRKPTVSKTVPTESKTVPTESKTVPTESKSVPTESKTVPTESVNITNLESTTKLMEQIENDLKKFKTAELVTESKKPAYSDKLVVGENTISRECLLYFLSGRTMFKKSGTECSEIFSKYYSDEKINLETMMQLSVDKNFDKDINFYHNLSDFVVGVADMINSNMNKISKMKPQIVIGGAETPLMKEILLNYKEFVRGALEYTNKFVDKYQLPTLSTDTDKLLLMYYSAAMSLADTGKNISDLRLAFDRLQKATAETIKLRKQYYQTAKNKIDAIPSRKKGDVSTEIIINRIEDVIGKLREQDKKLSANTEKIQQKISNIETTVADDKVMAIARKLRTNNI